MDEVAKYEIICKEIQTVDDIIKLFEEFGDEDYIGEPVSKKVHSIQAALLAEKEGYDNYSIIGALLHDIGHLIGQKYGLQAMDELGCLFHERIGYEVLKNMNFHEKTCNIVKHHVNAKRYLVSKNKDYYDKLSEASKQTLTFQGGVMAEEELKEFESDQYFELYIKSRSWDDLAKDKDMENIPEFESFRSAIQGCITTI
jgi:putative nucleotidyltransferase with HDIG domain